MALIHSYAQTPVKKAINALIIAHFDAHGVATAAARLRLLRQRGEDVEVLSHFPATGPQGLSSGQLKQAVEQLGVAPQRIEVIDIPVDVRNPDAAIKTLVDLAMMAPVHYYDHHETDVPFVPRLLQAGVTPMIFQSGLAMVAALELLTGDQLTQELARVGLVADRDASILQIVSRDVVEQVYLPAANRLDVVVRNPSIAGFNTLSDLIKALAEGTFSLTSINVDYLPERLAEKLERQVLSAGEISLLVDWSDATPQDSMWIPKALEQLLLRTKRHIAVTVTAAYDPRTRSKVGYDVRVLKYWLAPADIPTPEQVAKDLIAQKAITGSVVGHADYVSIRFSDFSEAQRAAWTIYEAIEGREAQTVKLVSDKYVAEAVRRDFHQILEKLEKILEQQTRMYEEYLELKKRQVELLERASERESTRYD